VERFLDRCGLSETHPVPGTLIRDHKQMLGVIRELLRNHPVATMVQLVHADAHADLAAGVNDTLHRVSTEILALPENRRYAAAAHCVTSANWLLLAVACRLVSRITHVRQHADVDPYRDYPDFVFKHHDPASGVMQLTAMSADEWQSVVMRDEDALPTSQEPSISFTLVELSQYAADHEFDFVVLCESPAFVPAEGDALLPLVWSRLSLQQAG
jgi:hypothetical protein